MQRPISRFVLALIITWSTALPAADVTPPQLVSLSLSATNLDVSHSNQILLVTARITDDLSGMAMPVPGISSVASLSIVFLSPSRNQQAGLGLTAAQRAGGNELDGIYTNQLLLPRYSESGVWSAQSARLSDAVGNERTLDYQMFVQRGIPAEITVTGTSDTTPPEFASFSFAPDATSSSNRTIQFTARVKDDLAGIANPDSGIYFFPSDMRAEFRSPSGGQGFSVIFRASDRISGDAQDGTYTNAVILPEFREPGAWTLESLYARDAADNRATLSGAKALVLGFPIILTVTGAGESDSNAPNLVELTLTPTNLNTTYSAQSIMVTARVTDDLSGFGVLLPFTGGIGGVNTYFTSPSGQQFANVGLGPQSLVSEALLDTTFTNTLILPRYSEPGLWLIEDLIVADRAGNQRQLDLAAIRNLGLPYSFIVEEFPLLKITLSENIAILSWPASASDFTLQTSGSCAPASAWSNVLSTPVQIGEELIVASPLSADQRFYRLIKQL